MKAIAASFALCRYLSSGIMRVMLLNIINTTLLCSSAFLLYLIWRTKHIPEVHKMKFSLPLANQRDGHNKEPVTALHKRSNSVPNGSFVRLARQHALTSKIHILFIRQLATSQRARISQQWPPL
ncbi:hypothetical protein CDAR_432251 [Caerostris darwini]|uniref:Uncharacterized protein n=1 Tax=Caerostris darwini TaxID=1538125 RepID=A0AAV4U2W4_9ARAC|nr:hypothetical protein CDAR_432251 [Caerostris darwini]